MATFFGEVISNSTRAYDEYEDELLPERYDVNVSLVSKKRLIASSLIVSFGRLANDFMECCVHGKHSELFGEILLTKVEEEEERTDTGDFHPRILKPSPLFISKGTVLLCQASEDIPPKLTGRIAKMLLSLIEKSAPVLVLTSRHASKLNSSSDMFPNRQNCTFSVVSPNSKSSNLFPRLPQPSILDSLPAAVMTESLFQDRPCEIYAAYTETSSPGDVDLVSQDFLKAISQPPFLDTVYYDKKYTTITPKTDIIDRYM